MAVHSEEAGVIIFLPSVGVGPVPQCTGRYEQTQNTEIMNSGRRYTHSCASLTVPRARGVADYIAYRVTERTE